MAVKHRHITDCGELGSYLALLLRKQSDFSLVLRDGSRNLTQFALQCIH